jgi:hypothetical protein
MKFADDTWGAAKDKEKEAFDAAKKKEDEEKRAAGGGAADGDLGAGLSSPGAGEDEDEYDTEADDGSAAGKKDGEKKKDGEVEKDEL